MLLYFFTDDGPALLRPRCCGGGDLRGGDANGEGDGTSSVQTDALLSR